MNSCRPALAGGAAGRSCTTMSFSGTKSTRGTAKSSRDIKRKLLGWAVFLQSPPTITAQVTIGRTSKITKRCCLLWLLATLKMPNFQHQMKHCAQACMRSSILADSNRMTITDRCCCPTNCRFHALCSRAMPGAHLCTTCTCRSPGARGPHSGLGYR